MMNQIILVGRLTKEVELMEGGKGIITLAIPRSYKNEEGIYETYFVPCTLWNGIATNVAEYCKKGDLVGVKGRLQTENNGLVLVAEKVTFLSSAKKDEE